MSPSTIGRMTTSLIALGTSAASLCGHQRHRDIQHPIAESPLVVAPAARVRSLNIRFAHVSLRRNEVGSQSKSRHFAAISAIVTSSIRLLNPHSLSYQLLALTSRPDTFVSVASNVDDAGSWLKSTDTSGAVLYFRMPPESGPDSEAAFMMAFTSSTLVSRAAMNVRSTIDTLSVGTRIA